MNFLPEINDPESRGRQLGMILAASLLMWAFILAGAAALLR
jgi:hypothetical protein